MLKNGLLPASCSKLKSRQQSLSCAADVGSNNSREMTSEVEDEERSR